MRETRTSGSTRGEAIVPRHRYLSYSTATPAGRRVPSLSGTKPECVLESTVSQSVRLSRIGWRTRGGACHGAVQGLLVAARTHRKKGGVGATPAGAEGCLLCRFSGSRPVLSSERTVSQMYSR